MNDQIREGKSDSQYECAINLVKTSRKCSISFIQRKMKISFLRSNRIVVAMEFDGIVTKPQKNGIRYVIAT